MNQRFKKKSPKHFILSALLLQINGRFHMKNDFRTIFFQKKKMCATLNYMMPKCKILTDLFLQCIDSSLGTFQ